MIEPTSHITPTAPSDEIIELFKTIKECNHRLYLDDNNNLRLAVYEGKLTDDLRDKIASNKSELITFLKSRKSFSSIPKAQNKEVYVASSAQKRLYFLYEFDKASLAYNMPYLLRLNGNLDQVRLESAFRQLLDRHEILRTSFIRVGDEVAQKISEGLDFTISRFKQKEEEIPTLIKRFIRPFNLAEGPLIRVGLVEMDPKQYLLMVDMHHIIIDGAAQAIFMKEFMSLYEGASLTLPSLQYKDYSEWQLSDSRQSQLEEHKAFWMDLFADEVQILELPYDRERPKLKQYAGAIKTFQLDVEKTNQLRRFNQEHGATMFMTFLAAFNVLLSKLSNQEDVVVGTPTAGRNHIDLEDILGTFINTLALRNNPRGDLGFDKFLEQLKQRVIQCFDHQDFQYEELVESLRLVRDTGRNPLFDVMFSFQDQAKTSFSLPGLDISPYENGHQVSKFDLSLYGSESDGEVSFSFEYSRELFEEKTIERFIDYFNRILDQILDQPTVKIAEIGMLSDAEIHEQLFSFNDTETAFSLDETVIDIFERQAASTPDSIALINGNEQLTYAMFADRINAMAASLVENGVKEGAVVAILSNRSFDMVASLYACLKCGCTFLPIEPSTLPARINFILDDSQASMILVASDRAGTLEVDIPLLILEELASNPDYPSKTVENRSRPESPAYLLYTSGSTGLPKGVRVSHKPLTNLLLSLHKRYPFGNQDRYLLKTSYTFDVSLTELFGWFQRGGALALLPVGDESDMDKIVDAIGEYGITHINLSASVISVFTDRLLDRGLADVATVRYVFSVGEAILASQARHFASLESHIKLENLYGPTEATIFSSSYSLSSLGDHALVPIGRPLENIRYLILDKYNNIQPKGVIGELCIGGIGLADGYVKREELTDEKFIDNPYFDGERLYKTGDRAHWLPNGEVAYLGRQDDQVKIRGFRIELGEIESGLLEHDQIQEAAVLLKNRGQEKLLVGYFTANKGLASADVRSYLAERLPEYMVPSNYVQLEKFPVTNSGKLNRKALPEPDYGTSGIYVAPYTEIEEKLVSIWSEVLALDKELISVEESFFELGGHSLKAMALTNKISQVFAVRLPVKVVFVYQDVRSQASHLTELSGNEEQSISAAPSKPYYKTSSAQQRQYFLHAFDKESLAYNLPQIVKVAGKLDSDRLEETFKALVQRHEVLRTAFEVIDEEVVQRPVDDYHFQIEKHKSDHEGAKKIITDFIRPFDLSNPLLLRVGLIQMSAEEHILMVDMHHIITDGISQGLVIREFMRLYDGDQLNELSIQYKDYSEWQQSDAQKEQLSTQREFWLNEFQEETELLELPTDFVRPKLQDTSGATLRIPLTADETSGLQALSEEQGTTMFITMLSLLNVLLNKLSNQQDIIVGTPTAGRNHADLEEMLGMFVNTLVLRNQVDGDLKYLDFLSNVKEKVLTCFEHQDYQYEELVEALSLPRDTGHNPLFDVMFSYQNFERESLSIPEISLQPYHHGHNLAKFDLTFTVTESDDHFLLDIGYATSLFKEETISSFVTYFKRIINAVTGNSLISIADIDILSPSDKEELLYAFNATKVDYPKGQSIVNLFEKQVATSGGSVALISGGDQITYSQLNARANQIARVLREKGLSSEELVGLYADRTIAAITGILGILKAGGAYLPLDMDYPEERLGYMLSDSKSRIVLSQGDFPETLEKGRQVLNLEEIGKDLATDNLNVGRTSDQLAYVMYTSGTTGNPKGVMVIEKNISRLLYGQEYVALSSSTMILGTGKLVFDASTFEIWGSLLHGGKLVLASDEHLLDVTQFTTLLFTHSVNTMWLTSSLFNQCVNEDAGIFSGMEQLIVGGEALSPHHINLTRELHPQLQLINGYGPTEGTTFSICHKITEDYESNIPLGVPINNTRIYILDKYQKLQPKGVVGELCIGGDGLTRGYLNNPELTNVKFVDDPFEAGQKIYKTGDLAKWLPDGTIEFLGRVDDQIKLRGFRIELPEIENCLLLLEVISSAVVLVIEQEGEKVLVAYYVSEDELKPSELRDHLSGRLPGYMVPAHFIHLGQLPITKNGKLDRRALPAVTIASESAYVAPSSDIQEELVRLWSEVLKLENDQISVTSNFFELGGHSLKVMVLANKISKEFDIKLPVKEVFAHQDILSMGDYISKLEKSEHKPIPKSIIKEYYAATAAQRRLFFLYEFDRKSLAYNLPQVIRLKGALEIDRLQNAFESLLQRHEILRTSFELSGNELIQNISQEVPFEIMHFSGNESDISGIINEFVRPFDLQNAPLFRVGLIRIAKDHHLLIVDMHHIISDGVSHVVLSEEFMQVYHGESLPDQILQYRDYAEWINSTDSQEKLAEQKEYWLEEFASQPDVLGLPYDYERPQEKDFSGSKLSFELDDQQTARLKELSGEQGTTMFTTILAIFNVMLSKISNQRDIVVGVPTAGRNHVDLERMLGMFVNTLVLRNHPAGDMSFGSFLSKVKDKTISSFAHHDYQYEDLIEALGVERDKSRNPLFDVMFSYQNFDTETLAFDGLEMESYPFGHEVSQFDLTLTAIEQPSGMQLTFEYSTELFKSVTIQKFTDYFIQVVNAVIANTEVLLSDIDILSTEERQLQLQVFNDTSRNYDANKTLTEVFENRVKQGPDQTALVFNDRLLSYSELQDQVNLQFARLLEAGVKPGHVVGLMINRSHELIVGMLAILKVGAAYLPIDPKLPEHRIKLMLEDTNASLLLTESEWLDQYAQQLKVMDIHDPVTEPRLSDHQTNHDASQLAYVLYTSGSTGKPKGVMVEHRSVINLIISLQEKYTFDNGEKVLLFSNVSFDTSVEQIWLALLTGGALVIADETTLLNGNLLNDYIQQHQVSHLDITPSFLANVTIAPTPYLKRIVVGGEKCPVHIASKYSKDFDVYNSYGPTEATVTTHVYQFDPSIASLTHLPLGQTIANSRTYILNEDGALQPTGVIGEIYIGGACLSRGYLNNPELTAKKFVEDPFLKGETLYKTGDLGRWLEDGSIEFKDRSDDQLKVRGFRVEAGEIENHLISHSSIEEVVILLKPLGRENVLVAYYLAQAEVADKELREHLSQRLPGYMIPTSFIFLEAFPVNINGKLDKEALPDPEIKVDESKTEAASETEEQLISIWSEILDIKKDAIGTDANFFDLGGNSLTGMVLVTQLTKQFDVVVPVKDLFTYQTIKSLSTHISSLAKSDYVAIPKAPEKEFYATSSAQQRLYFLYNFDSNSLAYNMPQVVRMEGQLDRSKLEQAFRRLIERHEILRTSIHMIDDQVVQKVNEDFDFHISYFQSTEEKAPSVLEKFIQAFDLSKAPLIRVAVTEIGPQDHILLVDMHHIINDGTSHELLIKEFMSLYKEEELAQPTLHYKDYSEWQRSYGHQNRLAKAKAFWMDLFSEEISALNMPSDYARPKVKGTAGAIYDFALGEKEVRALRTISEQEGVTMFMMLLSVYNVFLSKLSNQEDVVVGTPTSGRSHADLEGMIGMFINTLALRNHPKNDLTFLEFLRSVKENTLESFDHQEYQYEDMVEALNVVRDTSRNPLFDVMFSYQNFEVSVMEMPGLILKDYDLRRKEIKFDLNLIGAESGEQVLFQMKYSTQLFKEETIKRFARQYKQVVTELVRNPDMMISEISILLDEDRIAFEQAFEQESVTYPEHNNVIERFLAQVATNPDSTALTALEGHWTYGELEESVRKLSHHLQHYGEKQDELCFVMTQSPVSMIVSALGVLRVGKIFVPISNDLPEDQISELMSMYTPSWIIIDKQSTDRLTSLQSSIQAISAKVCFYDLKPATEQDWFLADSFVSADLDIDLSSYQDPTLDPEKPCYVYFTSGSTNKSKAILGAYKGLNHIIDWEINHLGLGAETRVTQLITPTFDAFFRDLFAPLCSGGALFIPPRAEGILKVDELATWLDQHRITLMHCGPSLLRELMFQSSAHPLEHLRYVLMSGEAIYGEDVKRWADTFGTKAQLVNLYGPSETAMIKFAYEIDYQNDQEGDVSIGQPIPGSSAVLLDDSLNPVATGTPGEIYIRTPFQTLGYFKDPELTNTSFIHHPMCVGSDELLYRTGDLAIKEADGNYSFLGRKDNQVKIQGIRVELGSIETHIISYPSVEEVAVFYDQEANILGACVNAPSSTQPEQINQYLSGILPNYMIPVHYHLMEGFPKNSNGKADRKALRREWEVALQKRKAEIRTPETPLEAQLVEIWSGVLKVEIEAIGTESNFFELGGNSLKAMILVGQLSRALEVAVTVKDLFTYQNVKSLSTHISSLTKSDFVEITRTSNKPYYATSSAQQRLYFLYEFDKDSLAYNMPQTVRLEGELDHSRLEQAFRGLVDRHEVLRTSFHMIDGQVLQKVHDDAVFAIERYDSSEDEIPAVIEEFVRPFDLGQAPLLRVGLIRVSDKVHVLVVDMHHIISDGTSQGILIDDFMSIYSGKVSDALRLQYKDYAEWQHDSSRQERLLISKAYWMDVFDREGSVLDLPSDFPRPNTKSNAGASFDFFLDENEVASLKSICEQEGVTMFMMLLAVFNVLLSKLSNEEDVVIGTPTSGRDHPDLQEMIGMFVNTLALRNYPKPDLGFSAFLKSVKESTLHSFDHQAYQYEDLVEALNVTRDTSRNPLFDVTFAYQNFERSLLEIPGLVLKSQGLDGKEAKFDLSLTGVESGQQVYFQLKYSTDLFKTATIERFTRQFRQIVSDLIANPDAKLRDLSILLEEDKKDLLTVFDKGSVAYPEHDNVIKRFLDQVSTNPAKPALKAPDKRWSYGELEESTRKLSHHLQHHGVGQDDLCFVMTQTPVSMIVSALGVLRAGKIFVPISNDLPEDQISELIAAYAPSWIILDEKSADRLASLQSSIQAISAKVCFYDLKPETKLDWTLAASFVSENPDLDLSSYQDPTLDPEQPCYVYFTSGSTNKSKAILGAYKGLNHFIDWEINYLGLEVEAKVSQLITPTFDAFFRDLFVPLCSGGTLFIPPRTEGILKIDELASWLDQHEINLMHCGPSLLRELMTQSSVRPLEHLRHVLMSGEAIYGEDVKRWSDTFGTTAQLVNLYGPSETTMVKFAYAIDYQSDQKGDIPIGQPIPGCTAVLLDNSLNAVAPGTTGEVCIRTPYQTLGYYKDPALTSTSFIHHPLCIEPDELLYRTGDLAIKEPNGNYSFVGRRDNQVKIQGIRVELGAIESHIISYPSVEEVVVFYDQKTNILGACLNARSNTQPEQINQYLSGILPNYMIPVHYHFMDGFPKNSNGKADRRALRKEWEEGLQKRKTEIRAPETPLEAQLVEIWSGVLDIAAAAIGTEANFFELGGNSLKAMILVGQLSKELEVQVRVKDIFTFQNIRSLGGHISGLSKDAHMAIAKVENRDYYATSSAQQRLYFLYEFDQDSLAYNMPQVVRLTGELDKIRLERAFFGLIERYEILRTSIHLIDDEVMQKVHDDFSFSIQVYHSTEAGVSTILDQFVRPFDLEVAPLFRVGLIEVSSTNHILIVDMHHIICDGTSHELLIREFMSLYNGESRDLPSLHYKDFSEWQRSTEHLERISRSKDHWLEVFREDVVVLDLPTDHVRPAVWDASGDIMSFSLNESTESKLVALCEKEGVTMFIILLSVFNVLLNKLSNEEDIVVGTPTSGRNHVDIQEMIGMFVNTLALRNYPKAELTFSEFLQTVKRGTLESFDHQEYQYEDLVEALNVVRDTSRNPLFDVMFSYQNFDRASLSIPDLSLEAYPIDYQIAKFDLTLSVLELKEGLRFVFEYSTQLFERGSIERFIRYFNQIIDSIVDNPDVVIGEIDPLTSDEKDELINGYNQTELAFDKDISIQQLFESQVVLRPEATALVFEGKYISYQELNRRSNQVANTLRSQGIGRNNVVGLLMDRSADMVVALLGVIKSGGAYLPIDASLPSDRIDYYLSNGNVALVLTNSNQSSKCQFNGLVINMADASIMEQSAENPERINTPEDLLYVIYTSGSTGKPKGVMVNHENYLNVTQSWFDAYGLDRLSVNLLQMASFSFDVFSGDVARALLSGGKMVVCPEDIRLEPENLYDILSQESINILESTPSLIVPLMSYIRENNLNIDFMKLLILGSDVCSVADFQWLLEDFGDVIRIVNSYGVTEATIDSSFYETSLSALPSSGNVPIGKPLGNVKYYVLDKHLKLLPRGVTGELYIGGKGVSAGYISQKDLTDERFLANPFLEGDRIYRTGDLVRWLPDGNLTFLGRVDDQVKIRGYRIELGEIASQLLNHDDITEAVVLPKGTQGDQYLVGYYLSEKEISSKTIKSYLMERLPDYMLPSFFEQVDSFQLTSNGKIDRKSLPDPTIGGSEDYMAPTDEVEEKLVHIWSKVLDMDTEAIGVNDHFFEIGGNSLKIIKLKSMIAREFASDISVAQLFTYTTISAIRNFLREGELDVEQYEKQSDAEVDLFENLIRNLN
ncbi:MAG: non-ribosomal peptide synthase/polyketide synthase [Cytophagales bacterium]|nr:non-ribosomal peptide synthase/polyketide synthase [Cytophagales bacterium]